MIKIKRGEYTSLFSKNPVLQDGQPCIATNKKITIGGYVFQGSQFVIGDGRTAFNSLPSVDLVQGNNSLSGYIVDGIIDSYTEDIWEVEKFASGKLHAVGSMNLPDLAMTSRSGNIYFGSVSNIKLPEGLTELPKIFPSAMSQGGYAISAAINTNRLTQTSIGNAYCISGNATTCDVILLLDVYGKWR